ncbi:MAG: hypothetical protein IPI69_15670 [Bacteroidales bacterium]|nr:hypothetical protein [Bacteroidales bacterium]NLK55527.1 hypothetical protein [Bacteroidales bacterium]
MWIDIFLRQQKNGEREEGRRAQSTGHRAQSTGRRAQGTGHRAQGKRTASGERLAVHRL